MSDDMQLLREYADCQSEAAFSALVTRYLGLVHSAALRQVRDPHLAEEITQAVFIVLARKAGSIGPKALLTAWLYRTTRFAAADALRTQQRRQIREHEAYMQSTLTATNPQAAAAWEQMAPFLDEAVARLGRSERDALLLRFFENKSLSDVGLALGTSEEAAKKRVGRGLSKLRALFIKRGITLSAGVMAGALSANAIQAASPGLAISVMSAAVKGTGAAASTLDLVAGMLKAMAWMKIKMAASCASLIVLAVGFTALVAARHSALRAEPEFCAAVFSVEGICRSTILRPTGPDITDYPFTISVSNCCWFLRLGDTESNAPVGYTEVSYDGKYTYFLRFRDDWSQLAARARPGTRDPENVAVGIITPHAVPHFPFAPESGAIWLAYASGCYFARAAGSSQIEPAASLGVGPHGVGQDSFLQQKAFWTTESRPPGVPETVTYLDDGIIYRNNGQVTRWPKPLDGGFTNATYQISAYTNLGPVDLPIRAGMRVLYPWFTSESAELVLTYKYDIEATNFTTNLLHKGGFKPGIPGLTVIDDWRFATASRSFGFNYPNRLGRWMEDGEARKLPEFRAANSRFQPESAEMFEAETVRRINLAKNAAVACYGFADDHQNQWPTSFEQLKTLSPEDRLSDSDAEFVSSGKRNSSTDLARTILFRERKARQSPDGGFVRVYGFGDFSVQVLRSSDGDFTLLERQRGYFTQPAKN